ncbi:MarR family winged helix-turn-helix transcriptional regulator [Sneathiella glossodoripedis]|uniref:MarR family winged helix-turn-helix transcriptional regulator n=1 Tax=Sneathiella glossodoripedis TaxID=418853 RepID=UPI00046E5E46|nr:MarR family transcriptional regulator [Sneathiella glossodoripedis]
MDYTDHRAGFVFADIARFRVRLFDRLLAPHGLTTSQAWVLAHLFIEDNLPQTELARRMDVGAVTIGGLIERLEARGFVERKVDSEDRRVKRVLLKEEAKSIGRIMAECGRTLNEVAFSGMEAEKAKAVMDGLLSVRQNLLDALAEDTDIKSATDILLSKK